MDSERNKDHDEGPFVETETDQWPVHLSSCISDKLLMFWRLFCLFIFTFHSVVFAGPLETLSQAAFSVTGNSCESYHPDQTEKQINMLGCQLCGDCKPQSVLATSLPQGGSKSLEEFEKLSRFAESETEDKFFALLAQQQSLELVCAADFAGTIAQGTLNENIQAKLDLARIHKQKLAEASKKLATDPAVAGRVCPLEMESLKSEFRDDDPAKKICESVLYHRAEYNAVISTIPLAEVPRVRSSIENFVSAKEAGKFDFKKVYSDADTDLKHNSAKINNLLTREGAAKLTRADRRALMSDPALIETVINSAPKDAEKNLRAVACRADARFGKGSENLETGVTIFALGFSAGAGLLARSGLVAAEVASTSARTAGMISLNSMRLINIMAVGIDSMTLIRSVDNACLENNLVTTKPKNACTSAPTLESVAQDDCVLMAALTATSYASLLPPGTLAKFAKEIKFRTAGPLISKIERHSDAESKQVAIWTKRSEGKVIEAAALEQSVSTNLKVGKIIDMKRIGHGASAPYFVRFEDGTEGVWKRNKGWPSDGRKEVAVYKIDKALDLDMVPVTVERKLLGEEGTVQLRVTRLRNMGEENFPHELEFFDDLIGNGDRHGRNYLQRRDGPVVAIDHGLSFTQDAQPVFMRQLGVATRNLEKAEAENKRLEALIRTMRDARGAPGKLRKAEQELARSKRKAAEEYQKVVAVVPDKKVINKLKTMTLEKWKQLLSDELSPKEIEELYDRQVKILREISITEGKLGQRIYRDGPVIPTFLKEEALDFYHPMVPPPNK